LKGSLDETGAVKKIPITKFPFVIGRNKSIDMVVLRSGISREHAEIISKDGRLFLRDLQSTNGTFVNKQRINSEVLLTHNTVIHFAQFDFILIDSEHKSSDDEMLTVVMNVDEALGLHDKEFAGRNVLNAPPATKRNNKPKVQVMEESSHENVKAHERESVEAQTEESLQSQNALSKPRVQGDEKVFIQGQWDDSNRRLHSRREVRWPVLVTLKSQQTIQCTTKDLSEAGIALTSPVSIQERALVKVDINAFYKGRRYDITALGTVRHSLITPDGFIVGVHIKSSHPKSSEFLTKFSNRTI
jgi:pSer/pThr/pTyr-binding forkhead associated (FHA) protein